MNYKGKRVLLTGASGFLGKKLFQELTKAGAEVIVYTGDVRDRDAIRQYIRHDKDYVFHFGSPSSQVLFRRNPMFCAETTLTSFFHIAKACREFGVKLIYPSTGLISYGYLNEYARCKRVCEDIHLNSRMDALGLRIFASYGPGEEHKRDYASVPYLFARGMVKGKSPVVFGDGEQIRDFIYIDDVVQAILTLAEEASEPIIDVGSGKGVSFNNVVSLINGILNPKDSIKTLFVDKPEGYIESTVCDTTIMSKYCPPSRTMHAGMVEMLETMK